MDNPYGQLQDFVAGLPEFLQPLLVALLGAVPYIEGEGSAAIGIIVGIPPIVAGLAGATGNILCVLGVIALTSRARASVVARRADARASAADAATGTTQISTVPAPVPAAAVAGDEAPKTRRAKGQGRLGRWLVRFGVPGASILAPLALPTQLTAAFFVASGVKRRWVMLWQIVAIVLWTGLVTAAATGLVNLLGWGA